jgi:hypothetical protein
MRELELVFEAGMKAFPPRLPEQPIFYPVLGEGYAAEIARDWNTRTDPFAGYVTRFEVADSCAVRYERHVVGGRQHEELWVPAEELQAFNESLIGPIEVVSAYFGRAFRGHIPDRFGLARKNAVELLARLVASGAGCCAVGPRLDPGWNSPVLGYG